MPAHRAIPEQINPCWLTGRLQASGSLESGQVVSVQVKARYKHHIALQVNYSADASPALPKDFILKTYPGGYPYGTREALFFDQFAPAMDDPPLPDCFDVHVDWLSRKAHILLADISSTHYAPQPPYQDLKLDTFERVLESQLAVHAYWWGHPRIEQEDLRRVAGLGVAHEALSDAAVRNNEHYFTETILPDRARGDGFASKGRAFFERVVVAWAGLFLQRIRTGRHITLIQGDAQLGNLMLPRQPERDCPILIDWEGCTRGLGTWDLARTWIQAGLHRAERQALEAALLPVYHASLAESGVSGYSLADCRADYRLCVLANLPHALAWENEAYLESALRAFGDWDCEGLLG